MGLTADTDLMRQTGKTYRQLSENIDEVNSKVTEINTTLTSEDWKGIDAGKYIQAYSEYQTSFRNTLESLAELGPFLEGYGNDIDDTANENSSRIGGAF